eukprot:9501575-Pyramimonas_sp.AAC.1
MLGMHEFSHPEAPRRPKTLHRPPQDGPTGLQEAPTTAPEGLPGAPRLWKTPREARNGAGAPERRPTRPKRPPSSRTTALKAFRTKPQEAKIVKFPLENVHFGH